MLVVAKAPEGDDRDKSDDRSEASGRGQGSSGRS